MEQLFYEIKLFLPVPRFLAEVTFKAVDPEIYSIWIFFKYLVPLIFRMIFQLKYFSCYIYWPNFIVWLPLLLEILDKMCILIICHPACDVLNSVIDHSFLIKPFFYITKKSGQLSKYLKDEKSF